MEKRLTNREKAVLLELAKNSRLSDRDLAARLKTSQPTITRIRTKLMKEKFIDRFMILPNLEQLGLFFQAVTFIQTQVPAVNKKMAQWAMEHPAVLFAGEGEGLRNHTLMFESLHSGFSDYNTFIRSFREKFGNQVVNVQHFFLDTENIAKFYHWHSVMENRLSQASDEHWIRRKISKMSNREKIGLALERFPNPLKKTIPKPVRPAVKEQPKGE
jgi:DNA-binding Lrp family transcriptional regulator